MLRIDTVLVPAAARTLHREAQAVGRDELAGIGLIVTRPMPFVTRPDAKISSFGRLQSGLRLEIREFDRHLLN